MIAPHALLETVAAQVTALGVRAAARRAPLPWRTQDDPGRYAVVTQVSPWAAALRGDDRTLRETTLVQIGIWETRAQAAESTDAGTVGTLVSALEDNRNALGLIARSVEVLDAPTPDSDDVHTVLTVAYVASR